MLKSKALGAASTAAIEDIFTKVNDGVDASGGLRSDRRTRRDRGKKKAAIKVTASELS